MKCKSYIKVIGWNKRIIKVPKKMVFIQLFLIIIILSAYNSSSISDRQLLNNYVNSNIEIPILELNSPRMNDSVHLSNSYNFVNSEIIKFELIKDYAYVLIHEENVTINDQNIIANIHYLSDNIWNSLVEDEKLLLYGFRDIDLNSSNVQINLLLENRTTDYNFHELKITYQSYPGVDYNNIIVNNIRGSDVKPQLWKSISEIPTSPLINLSSQLDWYYLSSFNINKEEFSKLKKLSTLNDLLEKVTNQLVSFSSHFNKTEAQLRDLIRYPLLLYLYSNQDIIKVEYITNIISPLLMLFVMITVIVFAYYIKDSLEQYQMFYKRGLSMNNIRDQVLFSSVFIPLIISLSFIFIFQYSLSFNFISNVAIIYDTLIFTIIWILFLTIINSFLVINQFRKIENKNNLHHVKNKNSRFLLRLIAIIALVYFLGKGSIQYFYPITTTAKQEPEYAINITVAILISTYLFVIQKITSNKLKNKLRGKIVSSVNKKYLLLLLIISGLVLINSFQYSRFGIELLDNNQRLEEQNSDIRIRFKGDVSSAYNLSINQLSKLDSVRGYFPSIRLRITVTSKYISFQAILNLIDNDYLTKYKCKYCLSDLLRDGDVYMEDRIIKSLDRNDFYIEDHQVTKLALIKHVDFVKFDNSDIFLSNIGGIIMTYKTWEDLGLDINNVQNSDLHSTYIIDIITSDPQNIDLKEFHKTVSNVLKYPSEKFDVYRTTRDTSVYFTQMINLTLIFSIMTFFISAIIHFNVIIKSKDFSNEIHLLLEKYHLIKEIKKILLQINMIAILFNFIAISYGMIFAYYNFSRIPDDVIKVFFPQLMGLTFQSAMQLGMTYFFTKKLKL
ncbi:MAG: hypothetical protein GPJ54_17455 [Candidatus Heimdallarchaeota archaeon]|nr:hypothetical protein [Candidatus Heimdallarchaeota archaeon]